MSNQMQTFVPREGRTLGKPMVAHDTVQILMGPETFDLTAHHGSVISDLCIIMVTLASVSENAMTKRFGK